MQMQSVTADFFRTLGIPLRRGRGYTPEDDTPASPQRIIINESLAHRFWPAYPQGPSPIGQHIRLGQDRSSPGLEIVGIAADVHEKGLAVDVSPELYLPCHMNPPQSAGFIVRTDGNPTRLLSAIRSRVLSLDPEQPISAVKTMEELVESSIGRQRLTLFLLGSFAIVALLLAAVGIYGVIAYSVAQRTQELGIRRALGAQPTDILWLVVGQGLGLTVAGIAIGIAGALAVTRVMKNLLFHINATDPATFLGVAILFVAVASAASLIPAWRATQVDPMAALRAA
jgi:putative ABC transport system permease protein